VESAWQDPMFDRNESLVRAYDVSATPPGTKACDAEGGAFRLKWREGSPTEPGISLAFLSAIVPIR
jgi:hypothetical protein